MNKLVTSKDGSLTMAISRSKDSIKSQRMVSAMIDAKRQNPDITDSELNYLAHGFKTYNQG